LAAAKKAGHSRDTGAARGALSTTCSHLVRETEDFPRAVEARYRNADDACNPRHEERT